MIIPTMLAIVRIMFVEGSNGTELEANVNAKIAQIESEYSVNQEKSVYIDDIRIKSKSGSENPHAYIIYSMEDKWMK